jgi:F-type H+-transporting ATPase subunit gamma
VLSSADIDRKIRGFRAIDDIIGAMKAYAGVAIRRTEELVRNIREYEANVLLALADLTAHHPALLPDAPQGRDRVVVAFGSSQGLCGAYNERIADAVAAFALPGDALTAIGRRLGAALAARGTACLAVDDMVGSVDGIDTALNRTASRISQIYAHEAYGSIAFVFLTIAEQQPRVLVERILPPDRNRLRGLPAVRFPPLTYTGPQVLFESVLEEFLAVGIYRCFLEALRSENWFRLRSMEGASEAMERHLADLGSLQKYVRQEEITEEMLEILGSGMFYR